METTLFLEVFGPFILVGTIYTLVLMFLRWRRGQVEPTKNASDEESPESDQPEDREN